MAALTEGTAMKYGNSTVDDALSTLGREVSSWRKIHGLTAQLLADRAGITRTTLREIENGAGSVKIENVMSVLAVLSLDIVVLTALDPLASDLGRARADRLPHKRVRSPLVPQPPRAAL